MTSSLTPQFAITSSRHGAAAIIELRGELDLAVETRLSDELCRVLAGDPRLVIIDLRGVSFMDARGIHTLISARIRCEEQGRRLLLIRGTRFVQRLLAICHQQLACEFVDSPAQALDRAASLTELASI